MTTHSFWLASGLLVVLAGVGLFTVRGELLALALPLVAYLGLAVLSAPGPLQLKAARRLSTDKITQGMEVTIGVGVVNEGPRVEELYLSDPLTTPVQKLEGDKSRATLLAPGEAADFEYRLRGWRGRYRFEGVQAQALEPFGLFQAQAFLPARGDILVYPEVVGLKAMPIRPPQTKGFTGPIPSHKGGAGMDFFGVREYQLGDALRHINWKISARYTLDLFTNEYEQERIADVGIILDARARADVVAQGQRLFEYAVQAAASLAEVFLGDGHCLSLMVYGAGIMRVYPGYGKLQRERVLRALAYADTGINYALENLYNLPIRLLPPHCQLVYISPLELDDLEALVRFRAQGYEVLVISPDPLHFERLSEADRSRPDFKLAERYAQIERGLLFNRLRRAGIQVVDWNVDQPLSAILDRARRQAAFSSRRAVRVLP